MSVFIRILLLPAGGAPEVREIERSLEAMQALVGGWIEAVHLADDDRGRVTLYCNEEGKLKGLCENRYLHGPSGQPYDVLVGNCFISREDEEGESISLTDEDIREYTKRFEKFLS